MEWKKALSQTIKTPKQLAEVLPVDLDEMKKIHEIFPVGINPYYLSLIQEEGDPIWLQSVPDIRELNEDKSEMNDPLAEEVDSPVPQITHRYPDRALFYVSAQCSMYCRFCTRKRKVSDPDSISGEAMEKAIKYLTDHKEIRDVIVSGGDPLMLSDNRLEEILRRVRAIPHIEIIRIGSRMPVTLPYRITEELCNMLKKYHPLYLNTHFNHPSEITAASAKACARLTEAGIPVGNQTVLLKGVNDDPSVMKKLMQKLLCIRVRPYYIFQADLVTGTCHFRTTVTKGLEIVQNLRGHTSGLAVPHYVVDAPGGGGKIAIIPDPVVGQDDEFLTLKNFQNRYCTYPIDGQGVDASNAADDTREPVLLSDDKKK